MGLNTRPHAAAASHDAAHPTLLARLLPSLAGKELHYYKERTRQIRVNAAGALLHDWAKEQAAIHRLIEAGRVVLL